MGNKGKYYFNSILEQFMLVFATGSVLQTVLLEMGLTPETTNQFTAVQSAVQILAILAFSMWSDRVKKPIKGYGANCFAFFPFLIFLFLCCRSWTGSSLLFALLFLTSIIYSKGTGVSNVLSYKMPYEIMDMAEYNKVSATTGVLTGITALALSCGLTWLQGKFSFLDLMQSAFAIAVFTLLVRIFVIFSLKPTHTTSEKKDKSTQCQLFKYKPFTYFIIPNLIRGLSCGLIGMAVSIGYYSGHLDSYSAMLLMVITSVVTILGCGIYAVIAGKIPERSILLAASVGVFCFMPLITAYSSTISFLTFYGLAWFMVVFINYAVPVAVTKIADYGTMGRYSAGRMLLHTAGAMLAGFLCVPLFRLIGVQPTMFIFAGMQLASGICYYIYMKKNNIR